MNVNVNIECLYFIYFENMATDTRNMPISLTTDDSNVFC